MSDGFKSALTIRRNHTTDRQTFQVKLHEISVALIVIDQKYKWLCHVSHCTGGVVSQQTESGPVAGESASVHLWDVISTGAEGRWQESWFWVQRIVEASYNRRL